MARETTKISKNREVNLPWGLQIQTQSMVHVSQAPNGKASECICPACNTPLIARNQGKINAPHFAHFYPTDQPGTCEGQLHETAKRLLHQRIQVALAESTNIPIKWACEHCSCEHGGDLLKGVETAHMEEVIRDAKVRPDIHLRRDDQPITLLEIVDTHRPEEPVHQFARDTNAPLLIFTVGRPEDIEDVILAQTVRPEVHYINACPCPKCRLCPKRQCDMTEFHHFCPSCQRCVEQEEHKYCSRCQTCITSGEWPTHRYCKLCLVLQLQKCGEEFLAASVMAAPGRCLVPPSPPGPPQH